MLLTKTITRLSTCICMMNQNIKVHAVPGPNNWTNSHSSLQIKGSGNLRMRSKVLLSMVTELWLYSQ